MLSTSLTSSYRQYKDDTNTVASWLMSTAEKRGFKMEPKKDNAPPSSSGRLKGKARKEARAAAEHSRKGSATIPGSPYIITTKALTDMAMYTASVTNPPVQVPRSISKALDRAITVRKSFSEQLHSMSSMALRGGFESDQGHAFFVSILEQIQVFLRPRMSEDALSRQSVKMPKKEEKEVAKVPDGEFVNVFSALHIDHPSEEFLQAPDAPLPTTAMKISCHEAELQQNREDGMLAFLMLLKDYQDLRDIILYLWREYRMNRRDLISVSITTDTAIDFARSLEEEVRDILEKEGLDELLKNVYTSECEGKGQDPFSEEMNSEKFDCAENTFWTAHSMLQDFHGFYKPSSDHSPKHPYEKLDKERDDRWCKLWETLTNVSQLIAFTKTIAAPTEDNLVQSLRDVSKTGKVPFTAAFAAQIFLGIHRTLNPDAERGFLELQKVSLQIQNSLKQASKFIASSGVSGCTCQFPKIHGIINQWVNMDPIPDNNSALTHPSGLYFKLLRNHPLLCGLFLYQLKAFFSWQGLHYANDARVTNDIAHLYNAAQQEGLLNGCWKDMELIYRIHSKKWILSGKQPENFEEYNRRFRLHIGYSASFFARNRRYSNRIEMSSRDKKGFGSRTPVSDLFRDRYCDNAARTGFTYMDILKMLKKCGWIYSPGERHDCDRCSVSPSSFEAEKDTRSKHKHEEREPTTESLLWGLCRALHSESVAMSFDYLTMVRVCWIILKKIKNEVNEDLKLIYDVGEYPPGMNPRDQCIVGWLIDAGDRDDFARSEENYEANPNRNNVFERAAKIMDTVICGELGELVSNVLEKEYGMELDKNED